MIDLATEVLNLLIFDQSVLEFDFATLRMSLSRFHILRFISFVIHGNNCGNVVSTYLDFIQIEMSDVESIVSALKVFLAHTINQSIKFISRSTCTKMNKKCS